MSGNEILLDTNAVGLYLDEREFAKKYLSPNVKISISVITMLEFLSNPELTNKNLFVFNEFIKFIEIYAAAGDNKELVKQIVSVRKKYKLKLPDAIIAATAIVYGATLLSTDDVFSKVHNLKFELIKL